MMRGHVAPSALVLVLALSGVASAGHALDKPAFTATPGELLAAAKAAPAGDWSMIVLRDESDTSYDDRGRATAREHMVYAIRTADAIQMLNRLGAGWYASYQDRPAVRARVIGPRGDVSLLDPRDVIERAPGDSRDRRRLEAVLGKLEVGSVLEYEIVTTDREPPTGGSVAIHWIGSRVPTTSTVISYSAPVARKLHVVARKLPRGVRPRHTVTGGRERWRYELDPLPPEEVIESATPDEVSGSYVGAATAASWAAVAGDYRALIERRLAGGPVEPPPGLPQTASRETADAIAAWLHRQIAYTGVRFDEAPYTPSPPAETMQRRRGSCLELATLWIALLRRAGIRADLALVVTGSLFRLPLDPELPGLGQVNYALVRARIGPRELWIDPIEELLRPGQLREEDQGRRALVIADDTIALTTAPQATSADNVLREVRSFAAAELGPAQLTVVLRGSGVFEVEQRGQFVHASADEIDRAFRKVATDLGGTLRRVRSTAADDLATPFEATLEIDHSQQVVTDRAAIEISLSPGDVLARLPWQVTEPEGPRRSDLVWLPRVHEVENRITVPDGFTLPDAVPDRVVAVGPARFTEQRRIEDRTLIVTFRFDTGKPRLSPAELAAVQDGVRRLADETVHLTADRTSFVLAGAGRLQDAVAEANRLIALHPGEALRHADLAEVLNRAGAGEAARREARKAVDLAPGDANALVVLGWILSHDRLGRLYTYDWDRAGAIAALQKARAARPKHLGAALDLARALQRDSAGTLFERDADLRGAIAVWRDVVAIEGDAAHAVELAEALLWAGQAAEAETAARSAAASEERDRWIVAAVAEARGGPAAIQAADALRSGGARATLVLQAGQVMLARQRYDVARELLAASGIAGQQLTSWMPAIEHITRHPEVPSGSPDPQAAVTDFFQAVTDPARKTPLFWDPALERDVRGWVAQLPVPIPAGLSPARFLGDVLRSAATVRIDGNLGGNPGGDLGLWRADVQILGTPFQIYLALDRGVAKVIGLSLLPSSVGRYILRLDLRDAASQARARRLLDWVRGDVDPSTASGNIRFRRVWGKGLSTSVDAIQLAAAVLAIRSEPDRAIAIGARCSAMAPDAQLACHEVLMFAYLARGRWADVVAELEAAQAQRPDEIEANIALYARALRGCGRFDDADRAIDQVLARNPDDTDALLARFMVAFDRGQPAEALRRADAVVHRAQVTPDELNDVAWFRLVEGSDVAAALDLARRAVQGKPGHAAQNTLAAVDAELGDLGRAVDDNREALQLLPGSEPGDADWYVAARIDEQLGLTSDAIAIYTRLVKPTFDDLSTSDLARKRLAVLRHAH